MKWLNTLGVVLFVFLSTSVYAQKDTGKISVFDNGENTVFRGTSAQKPTNILLMKFNIYTEFIGDVPVYFEKPIADNISIEAAPGVTFSNLLYDIIQPSESDPQSNFLFSLPYNTSDKFGIGYSFKIDLRYFPGKDNMMDGVYLSPELGYRHYVVDYYNGGATSGYDNGHTNVTDFKLLVGIESDEWISGLYLDYYCGFGFRLISGDEYETVTTQTTYFGSTFFNTTFGQVPFSYWKPGIYGGIKFGFGL